MTDIIILSDGSASDDEIAFVSATRGTGASPSSPVFVRASTSRTYEVLDDSDDDFLDLPSSRPNFDDLFGSVVADKPTITYTADNAVGTRSNSVEIGAAEPESNETLVSHTTVSESFSRSKVSDELFVCSPSSQTIEDILNDPSIYASPPASPQASTTESIENRPKTKKRKSAPRTRVSAPRRRGAIDARRITMVLRKAIQQASSRHRPPWMLQGIRRRRKQLRRRNDNSHAIRLRLVISCVLLTVGGEGGGTIISKKAQ